MGNFDNYYIDGNGNAHRDIPLGTSPADAYVRTNMKLKKEVQRMEGAIHENNEHIDAEISRLDEEIVNTADNASRQLESAVNDLSESIREVAESIDTKIASEVADINSRVDNIIAHNNDTAGNSELIDIREGTNGTVYASAGSAVRMQFLQLQQLMNALCSEIEPEFEYNSFISSNGLLIQRDDYESTDYLMLSKGAKIHLENIKASTGVSVISLFDINNKSFKETLILGRGYDTGITDTFSIPYNCFVIISKNISSAVQSVKISTDLFSIQNNHAELFKNLMINNRYAVNSENDDFYNANLTPVGSLVFYNNSGTNIPAVSGTLICIKGNDDNFVIQFFISHIPMLWYRVKTADVWSAWISSNQTSTDHVRRAKGVVTMGRIDAYNPITSVDLIPANTIYIITEAGISGLPENSDYIGTIITLYDNDNLGSINGTVQIYIDRLGKTAFRIKWSGTWTEWKYNLNETEVLSLISQAAQQYETNHLPADYYCSFALFETIGVVGDSYASGACGENSSSTTAVDHMNFSWPQILARKNGCSVTNYTKGGISTRTFITNTSIGLPALLSDTPKQMYILALERNDYNIENRGESGYLGAITDITNNSLGSYPDTFYGNYATIIENIMNHAPTAKIVMMTGDYKSTNTLGTSYNNAVEEIAEHYGLPCMVQLDEPFFSSDYYRTQWAAGGHPSAIIYSGMESAIERLFGKCVYENKAYFTYL